MISHEEFTAVPGIPTEFQSLNEGEGSNNLSREVYLFPFESVSSVLSTSDILKQQYIKHADGT